ncbi:ABC transporter permease [Pelagibius litoralis]|uniref:ABC transporter permease n=1 Tax=Pelagibius litoralis TaxID=374515 RepID=A0A967F0T2_9PROT|nr:ABC transporter permease [Pelagibius litoralis]NIA70972.1 ABC transporter permease [Pelagibius litoralis]
MTVFVIRRLFQSILTLFVTSLLIFFAVFAIGNPIDVLIDPAADQIEFERAMKALGLDQPIWDQYFIFLKNALQGDVGRSFVFNTPALELILQRFPATLELALTSLVIANVIGIPLGLYAGLKPESVGGRSIMAGSILGFSLPGFWVKLTMIMLFAVELGWFPAGGRGETATFLGITSSLFTVDGLSHIALPATGLSLFTMALVIRLTRSGVRETLPMDYIKFARAKGLRESRVISVHVLKNILIPIVTVMGLEFGGTVAFTVITETIFSWPGMGKLLIESINFLDRPVVVAYILLVATMFIGINLMVDLVYAVLDPRVRLSDTGSESK